MTDTENVSFLLNFSLKTLNIINFAFWMYFLCICLLNVKQNQNVLKLIKAVRYL